jgi:DNA-directed RNA polymerase specialized sigma24 family protein
MISSVIPSDMPPLLPNTALRVQISFPRKSLRAVNGYGAADVFEAERLALEKCLSKLPVTQRALVEAAYAPGVRMDELAKKSGRTAMSLYKALHRIRLVLMDCTQRALAQERLA